jgi:hypothetical protein
VNLSKSAALANKASNFSSIGTFIALVICLVSAFYLWKIFKKNPEKPDSRRPQEPRIPAQLSQPERMSGGLRSLDSIPLTEEQEKKKKKALQLAKEKKIIEAAALLEDIKLRREAIDLLEANALLDEAAEVLMRINRPGRAAVIFERNKFFGKAALFYLKANLKEDAKRCCKNVANMERSLLRELTLLFSQCGEVTFALTCLKTAKDGEGILSIIRLTDAYLDLAHILDDKDSRELLLNLITPEDFNLLVTSMVTDESSFPSRTATLLSECKKGEWVVPLISALGENRGMAKKIAEHTDPQTLSNYVSFLESTNREFIEKNRAGVELTARALYDSGNWWAAAVTYQSLGAQTLAGICWAMSGNSLKAIRCLELSANDRTLYMEYLKALNSLGRTSQSTHSLEKYEQETMMRVFFNVDPDTEKLKTISPF